jgi:hypothetical protein
MLISVDAIAMRFDCRISKARNMIPINTPVFAKSVSHLLTFSEFNGIFHLMAATSHLRSVKNNRMQSPWRLRWARDLPSE